MDARAGAPCTCDAAGAWPDMATTVAASLPETVGVGRDRDRWRRVARRVRWRGTAHPAARCLAGDLRSATRAGGAGGAGPYRWGVAHPDAARSTRWRVTSTHRAADAMPSRCARWSTQDARCSSSRSAAVEVGDGRAERALFADAQRRLARTRAGPARHARRVGWVRRTLAARRGPRAPYRSYRLDLIDGPDNWYPGPGDAGDRGIVCGASGWRRQRPRTARCSFGPRATRDRRRAAPGQVGLANAARCDAEPGAARALGASLGALPGSRRRTRRRPRRGLDPRRSPARSGPVRGRRATHRCPQPPVTTVSQAVCRPPRSDDDPGVVRVAPYTRRRGAAVEARGDECRTSSPCEVGP